MASSGAEDPPLKAVVLADFCGAKSVPYASTGVAQELPLHGSPLVHWQLVALSWGGVAEAVVLSSSPPEPKLPRCIGPMAVTSLHNPAWRSPGDALRDLESRVSLRPAVDFLLVHPGALFNLRAAALARAHAARAAADRNWLVTVVLRRAAATTPLTVATSSAGALCMYSRGSRAASPVVLDTRAENVGLVGGGDVRIISDVVDVGLDVCSPDLLVEFRENFDFDHVRDYVRAKLDGGEAELLGNRMFAHFVDSRAGEFAANVDSFAALMSATRDVFDGWMHPIVPMKVARVCSIPQPGQVICWEACEELRPGVIQLRDTRAFGASVDCGQTPSSFSIPEECHVSDVVMGRGARIEAGACVQRCVVGDGARICSDAVVRDSFLGAGSCVHANAALASCLLMDNAVVAEGVNIPSDCFLDEGVTVGRGGGISAGLKPSAWIMSTPGKKKWRRRSEIKSGDEVADEEDTSDEGSTYSDADDDDHVQAYVEGESTQNGSDTVVLGDPGHGFVLRGSRSPEYYLERESNCAAAGAGWPAFLDAADSDSDDELEGADNVQENSTGDTPASVEVDLAIGDSQPGAASKKLSQFFDEVAETMRHFVANDHEVDAETIALEVNSLKLGYERSYSDARVAVVRGLIGLARQENPDGVSFTAVAKEFERWSEVLAKFSASDSAASQRALVDQLVDFLEVDPRLLACVLKYLFDEDHVEEEVILDWVACERSAVGAGAGRPHVLEQSDMSRFIEWLEEEEDDEEEE